MGILRPKCSAITIALSLIIFSALSPVFALQRSRPGKGPDRIIDMKIKKAQQLLESAKLDADRASQSTVQNHKTNNFNIATGKLRSFTKDMEEIENMAGPNDPRLAELTEMYEATKKHVFTACADIHEELLAQTKAPENEYKGSDRGKLKEMIMSAWNKAYPNDHIIDVRFHTAEFKRTKTKRWNDAVNEWQYNDVSALAVSVIVKMDDRVATIYPAYINKDNQDGSISAGVHTKFGGYVVKEVLVKNL